MESYWGDFVILVLVILMTVYSLWDNLFTG